MMETKNIQSAIIAGVMLAAGAGLFSAEASVIVSYDAAIPTTNVLTSFDPTTSNGYQWRDNENTERDLGQSFLASTDVTMDSFSFRSGGNLQTGAKNSPFTVTIYKSATDGSLGTAVSTQFGNFLANDDAGSISGAWLTFNIDNIALSAGNYYTFILSFDNHDVQDQDQTFQLSDEGYSDGRLWQSNEGAAFASSSVNDFAFAVQIVPEPVTIGMLGVGSLVLLIARRKHFSC